MNIWVLADGSGSDHRSSPPPGSSWEADSALLSNERLPPSAAAAASGRLASVSLRLKDSECQIRKKVIRLLENSQHVSREEVYHGARERKTSSLRFANATAHISAARTGCGDKRGRKEKNSCG